LHARACGEETRGDDGDVARKDDRAPNDVLAED
jgi:hypothetical protein